jgi:hypothetical protein
MPSTADNFRSLLGRTATERTIELAATAIDTLTAAGASKEVIGFVIDAISAWDDTQYQNREQAIEELKTAILRGGDAA